jgi:thiamine kinase-like enzyme
MTGWVVLLDWEDVSAAPGVLDLARLLVSSAETRAVG